MNLSRREFVVGALAFGALGGSQLAAAAAGAINCAPPVADAQERVPPVTRKLIAAGFAYPEAYADIPGECLFSAKELPVGKPIRFTVTPRDCFGLTGKPLVAEFPKISIKA